MRISLARGSNDFLASRANLSVSDILRHRGVEKQDVLADQREMETEMRDNVLEINKYPGIVYDAPSVTVKNTTDGQSDVVLLGKLTLHGVTRSQQVPARIAVTGDMLRAFGEFSLRQSDYNIKPVSAVGGGLKVKDEVKFSFDIVARKEG